MPLNTGTLIHNRYRIARLIGQGGFGAVYRAWDTSLNRPCALKENLDTSQEAQRQFEREAQILAGLIHPHLPRVTDHFIVPGQGQYLVMDFVEGEDLASFIARGERVTEEQALTWMTQVADALVYLHNQPQPVIHRDIKPANIRITPEGKAMLVDFGLVKVYDIHLKTTIGARAVTPGYSPPEQYGRGTTDHRTDIYALAATLYTLLTGQDPTESIQRVVGDPLIPVDTLNPLVSHHLALVLEQAMALNPSQRYQSTKAFISALTVPAIPPKIAAPAPASPKTPGVATPPKPVTPRLKQKSPALVHTPGSDMRQAKVASTDKVKIWLGTYGLPLGGSVLLVLLLIVGGILFAKDKQVTASNAATATAIAALAKVNATGTADTLTAIAETASANATSTVEAISTFRLEEIEAETGLTISAAQLVFGPVDGSLVHQDNGRPEIYSAGVDVENFLVEATFVNPYSRDLSSWDYGFLFGDSISDEQLRLLFFSEQLWRLGIRFGTGYAMFDIGQIPSLRNFYGQSNHMVWFYQDDVGTFYVNGKLINTHDLSTRHFSGDVAVVTGAFVGNQVSGQSTEFTGFTVWALP